MQFGRSSERITRQIEQLKLQLEELETGEAEDIARAEASEPAVAIPAPAGGRASARRWRCVHSRPPVQPRRSVPPEAAASQRPLLPPPCKTCHRCG